MSHPSEAGTRDETSSLGAQLNTDVGICSPPPLLLLAANAQAAWPPFHTRLVQIVLWTNETSHLRTLLHWVGKCHRSRGRNEALSYACPFDGSTRGNAFRTLEAFVINGVLVLGS